jgi:hypothetical protein
MVANTGLECQLYFAIEAKFLDDLRSAHAFRLITPRSLFL